LNGNGVLREDPGPIEEAVASEEAELPVKESCKPLVRRFLEINGATREVVMNDNLCVAVLKKSS